MKAGEVRAPAPQRGAELLRLGAPCDELAISPDGRVIAARKGSVVQLADLELGQATFEVAAAVAGVGLVMSASHIVGPHEAGAVALYNVHAGKQTASLALTGPPTAAAISLDGAFVALGDAEGGLRLFRSSTGREVASCELGATVRALAFGADRRLHVAAAQRHSLSLPYLRPDAAPRPLHLNTSYVRAQGASVWWGSSRGLMDDQGAWWDAEAACFGRKRLLLRQGDALLDPTAPHEVSLPPGVMAMALHPCDSVIALGDREGRVALWTWEPWAIHRA